MYVNLECQYCGHKWTVWAPSKEWIDNLECDKPGCRDTNLTVKPLNNSTIDYYKGATPFLSPSESLDDEHLF